MPTVDEMLEVAEQALVDDVLVIDAEKRTINIPATETLFGVESDKKSERKYFRCPRYVGNNLDMMKANLYVNYENAGGAKDVYIVTDKAQKGDNVEFSWELNDNVTEFMGTVSFVVCAKWSTSSGVLTNEWNTTLATGTSLQGLEADEQVKHDSHDILEQLVSMYNVSVRKELQYNSQKRTVSLKG